MSKNKTNNAERDLADMKKLVYARNAEVDNLRRRVKFLEHTIVELAQAYASTSSDLKLHLDNRSIFAVYDEVNEDNEPCDLE
jgi:hypothetical protein